MGNRINRRAALSSVAASLFAARSFAGELLGRLTQGTRNATPGLAELAGKIYFQGDTAYEQLRAASVWNVRKPDRYPPAIVMAESEADIKAAIRVARARGWKVGVTSTGHSWVAPYMRNDALMLSISKMQEISIDRAGMTATVSPSVQGQVFCKALREQGLMFPTGHCYGVGLGGYILAGGHGWSSRLWGPACANLVAVDVITASGKVVRADKDHNADFYWAARGAGPGYFGVASRFHLRVFPLPTVMKSSQLIFPVEALEELFGWVRRNMNAFPKILEVLVIGKNVDNVPRLRISAIALGYSEAEVDAALAIVENAPFADKAVQKTLRRSVVLPAETENPFALERHGYRIAVDGMWTNASAEELMPHLRELFTQFPTPDSYAMWQCWGPVQKLDDMAYSIQGDVYLSTGAVYADAVDDERCENSVTGTMKKLEHLGVGSMMNDEDMVHRRGRYLSPEAARRLEAMRQRHDPGALFASFLEFGGQ